MTVYEWSDKKNRKLKADRNVSFEEVIVALESGKLLDIVYSKNQKKYKNQRMYIVEINNCAYLIPFKELDDKIILKTVIPNKIATKKYLL